ncbi:UNVERIFIED_CONTAM: Retrovirus-related Pol polyprotein from type-2 retrotransposable element R2DM [Sesamum angustifolium]|uniref:Retrovirus-related Pol polyprotein from type-2 retrotransposable element R2DM n=1 Tax=Sesamum angustifolium TaxID=2727405 RepID=A0AAW2J241_9LAMI
MDIIKIQATLEASEIEAQDIQESSDKEEIVTPIFNRFQSLEDNDSLLELDLELQVIPNSTDSTPGDYIHDQGLDSGILPQPQAQWKMLLSFTGLAFILFSLIFLTKSGVLLSLVLMFRNPRRALWEELKRLSLNKVPWIVGGDFNIMLHTHKNRGGTISNLGSIEDFNDMVLDSGLTDAGFEGEPFTWSNKRVWRRLDRVLYSQEWAKLFNSTRVSHLPRRLSDHHPLLIYATRTEDKVPSSFRFQHMWIMHPNFQEMIKQSWGAPIHGYGMYRLQQNLYRLNDHLKQWNRDIFGNVFSLVDQAKAAANEAEKQFDRLPSEANLINLNRQNVALVYALNLESEFWRQKRNCKWLEAGERNTKFFHSSVKKKRLKSRISRVMDNQQEITDSAQIKESAVHFFGSILCDTSATSLPHDFPFQFPQVQQDVLNLSQPPSQEDIKEVHSFKLVGTIAEDVFAAVTDFFRGTPMPRSVTATSIILIPKNDSPQSWSEFRPISSTMLIADNILLAQEMTHHLDMRHSKGNLILKLDMSKAYDRVKWKFLYSILEKMGFPARFIALIKHAIEHYWFTILVNGESSGFFKSSQGLRQGDPISPVLFILASEALSRGLNHLFVQNPNMLYQTGCKTRVTHLAYADDIIIFTRCEEQSPNKLM